MAGNKLICWKYSLRGIQLLACHHDVMGYLIILLLFITSAAAFCLTIKGYRHLHGWLRKTGGWLLGICSFLLAGFLLLLIFLKLVVLTLGGAEHISASESPDGRYTVDFMYFDAGATGTFGVRGELDGPLWFRKHVYFEQRVTEANVQWENNGTIVINGHHIDLQKGGTFGYKTK